MNLDPNINPQIQRLYIETNSVIGDFNNIREDVLIGRVSSIFSQAAEIFQDHNIHSFEKLLKQDYFDKNAVQNSLLKIKNLLENLDSRVKEASAAILTPLLESSKEKEQYLKEVLQKNLIPVIGDIVIEYSNNLDLIQEFFSFYNYHISEKEFSKQEILKRCVDFAKSNGFENYLQVEEPKELLYDISNDLMDCVFPILQAVCKNCQVTLDKIGINKELSRMEEIRKNGDRSVNDMEEFINLLQTMYLKVEYFLNEGDNPNRNLVTDIDVEITYLQFLPSIIFKFPNLKSLLIPHIGFEELSKDFLKLKELQTLRIGSNLQSLPDIFNFLPKLKILTFIGKLKSVPDSLIKRIEEGSIDFLDLKYNSLPEGEMKKILEAAEKGKKINPRMEIQLYRDLDEIHDT